MLQSNLDKLKQFVLTSDNNVFKINTYNNLKIKDKTFHLILFSIVHKPYSDVMYKLAIVDAKAFESQDWQATYKTVRMVHWVEDILELVHNFVNNKKPNINWDKWKYSRYKKEEDFLECGLPKGHYIFRALEEFDIDLEKDDKDFSFLKVMNDLYKRFNENYIFIHKQLKEDEIIVKLEDEDGNDFKVKFKISLDLISIDDRLYKSTTYPSQHTELIASYRVNYDTYQPTIYKHTNLIETQMLVDFDLLKLKKQDLNLNNLESFINKEFSSYECEYKNPEWDSLEDDEINSGKYEEYLYHQVDLTSQMKTSFNKLIDEALEEIVSNPNKYKKFN